MSARIRKLIGLFVMVAFLIAYVVLATLVSELMPKGFWPELIFYVVAGTCWFIPLLPLISWMNRGR